MDVRVTWYAGNGQPRISYHKVDKKSDIVYRNTGVSLFNSQCETFYPYRNLCQVEVVYA